MVHSLACPDSRGGSMCLHVSLCCGWVDGCALCLSAHSHCGFFRVQGEVTFLAETRSSYILHFTTPQVLRDRHQREKKHSRRGHFPRRDSISSYILHFTTPQVLRDRHQERRNTLEEVTFLAETLPPPTFYTSQLLSPQQQLHQPQTLPPPNPSPPEPYDRCISRIGS